MTLTATELRVEAAGRVLLQEIDLSVPPGSIVAIIGPNGAGKTTLLQCLSGARAPNHGSVCLDQVPLRTLSARTQAERCTFVPQRTPFQFAFTVAEFVALGSRVAPIDPALRRFGLAPLQDRSLLSLSGGEQQRAVLARALAQSTPLWLLDEPTTYLDLPWQQRLSEVLFERRDRQESTILAIHDLNLACRWADRLICLKNGRLIGQTTPDSAELASLLSRTFDIALRVEYTEQGVAVFPSITNP